MAADEATGLGAAVQLAAEAIGPDAMRPALALSEQLALIPAETPAREAVKIARQGPGRRLGSVNKRTKDMAAFILSRYRSPLIFLAEAYNRSVEDLQAELGCTKEAAYALQLRAATELAPYLHGKMPVAVDMRVAADMHLVIPGFNSAASTIDKAVADIKFLTEGEDVEYQEVSE